MQPVRKRKHRSRNQSRNMLVAVHRASLHSREFFIRVVEAGPREAFDREIQVLLKESISKEPAK
jgi:hypothetical protein